MTHQGLLGDDDLFQIAVYLISQVVRQAYRKIGRVIVSGSYRLVNLIWDVFFHGLVCFGCILRIINVRVDPDLKARIEKLYGSFGLSVTDAINIFLYVSLMEGGLPFEVRQPRYNAETEAAIEDIRKIMDGSIPAKRYTSVDDMFNDALAEDTVHA